MFIKKQACNRLLSHLPKKSFFLNYLKNRGLINVEQNIVSTKNESVDFKDLLDENKIRITYYDIIRDYFYFTDAYYYYRVKAIKSNLTNVEPKLGFDSKSMDLKKVLLYVFVPVKSLIT
jgi:hypothetical protein